MKKRIVFLLLIFLSFWGGFLLQKPLFMLYNGAIGKGTALADYFRVLYHGASLDAATAGYLTAIPWLVILISFWLKRVPLRKILGGYYLLIALIVSCIGIADMSLYPFWGFKLDASIFQYLDSPKNAMASVSAGFIALRIVFILILAALLSLWWFTVTPQKLEAARQRLAGTGLTLLLGGVLFIIIRGGVTESTSNIGQAYFCNDEFLNHSAVNPAFSLLASAGKTQKYEEMFDFFPEEERKSLFEGLYPTQGENTVELLNTRRPNILVILMEGFGGVFVEPLGGSAGCQSEPEPSGERRYLLYELLCQQLPYRPRYALHIQRLPELPHPLCHEDSGQEPYPTRPGRETGERGLSDRFPVRG